MEDFFELMREDRPESFPPEPPKDWDPNPDERAYYRDVNTGDRGYLVRREGKDKIRLDRPMEEILRQFNPSGWVPDADTRALSLAQVAQIAFAADRKICFYTGKPELAKMDWLDMREDARIAWIKDGPPGEMRQLVFRTLMATLQPWTR